MIKYLLCIIRIDFLEFVAGKFKLNLTFVQLFKFILTRNKKQIINKHAF